MSDEVAQRDVGCAHDLLLFVRATRARHTLEARVWLKHGMPGQCLPLLLYQELVTAYEVEELIEFGLQQSDGVLFAGGRS